MSQLKIVLGRYNDTGVFAAVEGADFDDIYIHVVRENGAPKAVCRAAAKKLHLLADAFEVLANMEEPLRPRTHAKAMRHARERQKGEKS